MGLRFASNHKDVSQDVRSGPPQAAHRANLASSDHVSGPAVNSSIDLTVFLLHPWWVG